MLSILCQISDAEESHSQRAKTLLLGVSSVGKGFESGLKLQGAALATEDHFFLVLIMKQNIFLPFQSLGLFVPLEALEISVVLKYVYELFYLLLL